MKNQRKSASQIVVNWTLMNADLHDRKHSELTEKVIKVFYDVYNALGYGFLEKVYENALLLEFSGSGITAVAQHPINVYYNNAVIGASCKTLRNAILSFRPTGEIFVFITAKDSSLRSE